MSRATHCPSRRARAREPATSENFSFGPAYASIELVRKEAVRKLVRTEADVLQSGLQPDKPGIAALCWWRADGAGGLLMVVQRYS